MIPTRARKCHLGGETFEPESEYISQIEGDERRDFCPTCWEKIETKGIYWRGKIPPKKAKTTDEKALILFRELIESQNHSKLLSLLILYLQRHHQLARRHSDFYEVPETGETFKIKSVKLDPEEGEEIGKELFRLLEE